MQYLFTPVGNTDPVRDYHDGGMLHILRHYKIDKVFIFLTADMEEKEEQWHCYSLGVKKVAPQCEIEFIKSGITEPQNYEKLLYLQEKFDELFEQFPDVKWILNISSGTPQMKTIMSFLSVDYPSCTAVQVSNPHVDRDKVAGHCEKKEYVEMLECNEDDDPSSPNRCTEPPLLMIRRHGLRLQIESLVRNYEYGGALQLVEQNRRLFSDTTERLLRHGVCRTMLNWREANKIISDYNGKILMQSPSDFSEYFQLMELRQRKEQLSEFIVKLSPVLMGLGFKYLECIKGFDLLQCGRELNRNGERVFRWDCNKARKYNPELQDYLDKKYPGGMKDGPLYFQTIMSLCEYYKVTTLKSDALHNEITTAFSKLRTVEETARNPIAHNICNMTEARLEEETKKQLLEPLNSAGILRILRKVYKDIYKKNMAWTYDGLNDCIVESLQTFPM